jgi:hypothetical protein
VDINLKQIQGRLSFYTPTHMRALGDNLEHIDLSNITRGVVTILGHRCGALVPFGTIVLAAVDMLGSFLGALRLPCGGFSVASYPLHTT